MVWWSSLDNDIYEPLEDLRAGTEAAPSSHWNTLPERLGRHVKGPTALFARQVATPNYEMLWFTRLARRHGLKTLVIEHVSDRFTMHNPTKLALATVPIVTGRSRSGEPIFRRQRMLEPADAEGQRIDEIITRSGESLLDYHHRKLKEVMGTDAPDIVDLRDIVPASAADPVSYYTEFFKMLSGYLVLLEDFVANDQTAEFFRRTILPAWRSAALQTGRRPQIARLTPGRKAASALWYAYPATMADNLGRSRRTQLAPKTSNQRPDVL